MKKSRYTEAQICSIWGFLYVDNMYCINDQKYVAETEDGGCTLTSYARQHVDECCLKFK